MATITTRVISGKGLLRLPGASYELEKARRLFIYVDVIRLPFNQYTNYNYNPPKSRYGTINAYRQGYQVQEICIEYPRQVFEFPLDISAQTDYLLKCNYHLLLEQLIEMSAKLGLLTDNSPDSLAAYKHQKLWFDELKVVCYADTALQIQVRTEELFLCPADEEPDPLPPPEPPPQPTDVPPGTSLGDGNIPISDPYQGDDDDGDTQPYPGDEFTAPPDESGGCWKTFTTYSSGSPSSTTDYTYGLSTDTPVLVLPPGSLWWQMRNGSVSGRLMRDNWVSTASTPTLVSAEWQPTCETTEIYGIPPG